MAESLPESNNAAERTGVLNNKWFILTFFLAVLLMAFYVRYLPYEGKITHSFPMTINAADPNSRLSEADWVKESRQYDTLPPWFSDDPALAQHYAPGLLIVPAALSQVSGIEVYDLFFFIGVLVGIGIAISWFLVFLKFLKNSAAAFIVTAIIYFPYERFSHYQINIGMYGNFYTGLFYPLAILFLYNYLEKPTWANAFFLTLIVVFQYYVHASEALVFLGLIIAYLFLFRLKEIPFKHLVGMGIFFVLLVLPHLPLLYASWFVSGHGHVDITLFKPYPAPAGEPQFGFLDLLTPILYVLFVVGLLALFRNRRYQPIVFLCIAYLAITFFIAWIGIGSYYITIRARYLLYTLMYPLAIAGLAIIIHTLSKLPVVSKAVSKQTLVIAAILIAFVTIFMAGQAVGQSGGTLITKAQYDGFLWLRMNSDPGSRVLCLGCYQFELLNSHRKSLNLEYAYKDTIQQIIGLGDGSRNDTIIGMDYIGYRDDSPKRMDFFHYQVSEMQHQTDQNLCGADYLVIKPYPQLTDSYLKIGQRFLARNSTIAFQNQQILIIRNNNVGGRCI